MSEPTIACRNTVGWVLDKDTSKRRIHVHTLEHGAGVGLTVEVYGQQSCIVELDDDGVVILRGLLGQALERVHGSAARLDALLGPRQGATGKGS